jgi:uncharacterized protein
MKYLVKNLRIPVQREQNLESEICRLLNLASLSGIDWKVSRRALDTRKRNQPVFVYTIELVTTMALPQHQDLVAVLDVAENATPRVNLNTPQPFIIGMGPAGLFCALAMVQHGLKPWLFDRGEDLRARAETVTDFWKNGILNPESNVQFGEGGAGAFSDGKLTSRNNDSTVRQVFDILIRFGAPESIRWEALPHLGTDGIRQVVSNIRDYLVSQGCRFFHNSSLTDLTLNGDKVSSITINHEKYNPKFLVLAPGNAARDTFRMLADSGVILEPKPFSIGFRISHPQDWIDAKVYGSKHWTEQLGPASYRLTAPKAGKGTYTFCMCPGGYIIAASSVPDSIVTNGMSYASRDLAYGNCAVVTGVDASVYGNKLFDGMDYQSSIENKAFQSGYPAPYQLAADYLQGVLSSTRIVTSLFPSATPALLQDFFPKAINSALQQGLKQFDSIMPGFIHQGLLIAPETRTSSPVRIVRDKANLNCLGIRNLYAIGEGAGYAGGIISSSADGFRVGTKFAL